MPNKPQKSKLSSKAVQQKISVLLDKRRKQKLARPVAPRLPR